MHMHDSANLWIRAPAVASNRFDTVVVGPDATVTADELKAFSRERLALYKTPREIRFTTQPLPRTASGKVDRGTFVREAP